MAIGKRDRLVSRRELTKSHAREKKVAIREMKQAAIKWGKFWPPRDRKLLEALLNPALNASIISRL